MQSRIPAPDEARRKADVPGLGIGLALVGSFCFVVQDSGMKWLTAELAVLQIIFLRSLFGILFLVAGAKLAGRPPSWRVRRPWLMLARTLINVLCWCLFFSALKYLPLATATALFFTFPIFLTALSVPLLGETVGPRRWAAVLFGFAGVVLMTKPGDGFDWPVILMLVAAFGWALVAIATRTLGRTESATTMLFYTLLGFVLTMAVPQFWLWQPVEVGAVGLVAGVAVFGVFAQFCLIKAYSVAPPSIVAPFEYSGLIWAALFGFLIWRDIPDVMMLAGASMIVAGGLYIIHREAGLRRRTAGR